MGRLSLRTVTDSSTGTSFSLCGRGLLSICAVGKGRLYVTNAHLSFGPSAHFKIKRFSFLKEAPFSFLSLRSSSSGYLLG